MTDTLTRRPDTTLDTTLDTTPPARPAGPAPRLDHFIHRDGVTYAGTHLIIDIWEARRIDDLAHVRETLLAAARAANATVLNVDLHHFNENDGVSGVVVLAESHISIHSWPEVSYAALDIFTCGDSRPHAALPVLAEAFQTDRIQTQEIRRGILP